MGSDAPDGRASKTLTLWDLPVRLVHWSFVLLIPALWGSWKAGNMDLHKLLGHVTLALLVFRLFWGVAGSATARFPTFLKGPRSTLAYVRALRGGGGEPILGHNPLGALSVVALLLLMLLQVGLGLISEDSDGLVSGPLAKFVSYETSEAAHDWHETIFWVLLAFVGLHIAAILSYLVVKRENLVGPMVSGRKVVAASTPAPAAAPLWRALVGALLAAAFSWWIWLGAPV